MARRRELRAISRNLLQNFVSRYNDLNGYWAFGFYAAHCGAQPTSEFRIDLKKDDPGNADPVIAEAAAYYPQAMRRMMLAASLPDDWLQEAAITVRQIGPTRFECQCLVKSDLGHEYAHAEIVDAQPHNPDAEGRTMRVYGPTWYKGQRTRRISPMKDRPSLIFWFEFASTYSYLAASRIEALAQEAEVDLIWRPFLLGPIFHAQGWNTSPFNLFPVKGENMWRDMERLVAKYDLPPLTKPDPFPQNGLLAARIAALGANQPWGPDFVRGAYRAQFADGRDLSDEAVLVELLYNVDMGGKRIVSQAKTDQALKNLLRSWTEEAISKGLYGAPSFTTEDGELFWGNDRLEDALSWATKP